METIDYKERSVTKTKNFEFKRKITFSREKKEMLDKTFCCNIRKETAHEGYHAHSVIQTVEQVIFCIVYSCCNNNYCTCCNKKPKREKIVFLSIF